ncbi:Predicted arabinose efflux permease, MFS family [Pacificibacter marinus]|uniref:Major Facilitator Superfamily protein n=2 Tax=Pacificibacter marinus TaxID=658057 RepID=A0A1Y5RKR4_9RHOB|nr:Predicted arabinose efflux permease, MFS family [Pacificibacter marinus]SLN16923.1 Major Facilitator Superfamily protein [Pacificibacter marinus]
MGGLVFSLDDRPPKALCMKQPIPIAQAAEFALWRRPVFLLFLMAFAMPIAFNTWSALLNNFVIEVAGFTGVEIGWLHTVREIPGFLAVGVIALMMLMREQILGLVALLLLGVATALTAYFPSFGGILTLTMLSSIGFHYYETVNQSLQLQWIDKARAPQVIGWLMAAGSAASLLAYGVLVLTWKAFDLSYTLVYMVGGGVTAVIAIYALIAFPQFESPNPQLKKFILRRRYWLYYALQFMAGARRQIFVVFAAFMMVEKFGFDVHQVTSLFMINFVINMIVAPLMGRLVSARGERFVLLLEYAGLIIVFLAYGGLYWLGWGVVVASVLYVVDHMLFGLAFALKTYFQKIADPQDIAPTAAVAFTINHIAAVFLPAALGYLWIVSPSGVFILAAAMACVSFGLGLLIPRHPEKGYETILTGRVRRTIKSRL